MRLASTRLGQLSQAQKSVVTWDWLECDVAVPAALCTLFLRREVEETLRVNLLRLLRADDTDLIVASTETTARVDDRVNVQF